MEIIEHYKQCTAGGREVTNFENVTASPEALATFLMHDLGHAFECTQCPVDDCDGDGDCILLFKDWLEKEAEK